MSIDMAEARSLGEISAGLKITFREIGEAEVVCGLHLGNN
jgi:hypothetical protein